MVRLDSAFIAALSIATTAFAASSWSFSDASLVAAPKGKEATTSHPYHSCTED
jgi:hypothetical protein